MSEQEYFEVGWDANKYTMKVADVCRRHWVSKYESGRYGSGKMMKIWKQRLVDNCHRCNEQNETLIHIF